MKTGGLLFLFLLFIVRAPLHSQQAATSKSVFIEAVESTGGSQTTDHWRSVYGGYNKTRTATRELGITIRNMSALPGQFDIEWYFVGKPASGGRRFLYDKGSKQILLEPGKFERFAVESKELSSRSVRDYYYSGYNYKSGDKADGWIIRAKVGEEVVRVKASNPQLEQLEKNKEEFARFVDSGRK